MLNLALSRVKRDLLFQEEVTQGLAIVNNAEVNMRVQASVLVGSHLVVDF